MNYHYHGRKLLLKICLSSLFLIFTFQAHTSPNKIGATECVFPKEKLKFGGLIKLIGSCTYHTNVTITQSNTILDCNGATISGGGEINNGIMILGRGQSIKDILIKNCHVTGFKRSGIGISSGISADKLSANHNDNYHDSPSDIRVLYSNIEKNGRVGIYIDSYVTNTTIESSSINWNGGVGVYLEHSTKKNKLINNRIMNNGYSKTNEGEREGIAIDSSANNLIENNEIINNAAGGIYLYKNCGEKYSSNKSVLRWQHSDFNIIKNNKFYDQLVGVWISSRQSRDLSQWDCGDKSMGGGNKYYEDFANNNTILNNSFCRNKVSVRIEGDDNKVIGNEIDSPIDEQILKPVSMREVLLGKKAVGNIVSGNVYGKCNM